MSQIFPKKVKLKNGTDILVEQALPADAEKIVSFLNQVGGESDNLSYGENECWQTVDAQRSMLEGAVTEGLELVLKAEVDGSITGLLTFFRDSRPRLLHIADLAMAVSASYWNKGLGTHLLTQAISWAKENGIRKINLKVKEENAPAIAIYQKLGFRVEGASTRGVFINGQFYSDVMMGLEINI
jgi:RimJ/RimL family protein N-acetyltransferase